ncbi:hypothetical protein [Phycicoccus flavus]|uniref:hypothetical protein n=1 Tax=Phycicoccus flavus TaxID=2502783 RepID=UPI000FEB88AC|nr:hypothetical protein [Phycicoccus flavus]NHA66494.1 hypothetical protein [Phycicoccus flavus]
MDIEVAEVVADQHARIRDLFHEAAHAPVEHREAACSRLVRYLAVHEAAEHEALHPDRGALLPDPGDDGVRELGHRAERLEDLGPRCESWSVQLGLLAAAVDHHVVRGEADEVPRFVALAAEADLDRAVRTLRRADDLVADVGPAADVPASGSFAGQLRAARRAVAHAPTDGPSAPHPRGHTNGAATGRPGRRAVGPVVSRRRAGP